MDERMTGLTSDEREVALDVWHASHNPASIGGSIYAVVPGLRISAARAIHAAGSWVHADVILDPEGNSSGVTPGELLRIRTALPEALIDVHLIVNGGRAGQRALDAVRDELVGLLNVRPQRLTLSAVLLDECLDEVDTLRRNEVALWLELAPEDTIVDAADWLHRVDGVLVMLITPGTAEPAEPAALAKVSQLAGSLPVGVDGGVTRAIARNAIAAGADYLVSGRALLRHKFEPTPSTKEA